MGTDVLVPISPASLARGNLVVVIDGPHVQRHGVVVDVVQTYALVGLYVTSPDEQAALETFEFHELAIDANPGADLDPR